MNIFMRINLKFFEVMSIRIKHWTHNFGDPKVLGGGPHLTWKKSLMWVKRS